MTDMPQPSISEELARLAQGGKDALCDSMFSRLADTAGNTLEVVDKLNDPDVKEAIVYLLDNLGTLHRTGVLTTVVDLLYLVHGARNAATDSIVDRVFAFMEHMANNVGTEDLGTLAHEAKCSVEDALEHCQIPGASAGLFGTLRMLSKPETQEAMRFMLAFACSLRKRVAVVAKTRAPL